VVRQRIDNMGRRDRMMLIIMDGQVRSPTGDFTSDRAALREALDEVRVTATEAQLVEALRTGNDALGGRIGPELLLVSDSAHTNASLPKNWLSGVVKFQHRVVAGDPLITLLEDDTLPLPTPDEGEIEPERVIGNVAISGFNIRRYLSNKLDYELFIQVRSHFKEPVCVELALYSLTLDADLTGGRGETPISLAGDTGEAPPEEGAGDADNPALPNPCQASDPDHLAFELAPEGRALHFYKNLAAGSENIMARVKLAARNDDLASRQGQLRDALPVDDEAYVLVPRYRRSSVLLLTRGNLFLEAALLLNDNFNVVLCSPFPNDSIPRCRDINAETAPRDRRPDQYRLARALDNPETRTNIDALDESERQDLQAALSNSIDDAIQRFKPDVVIFDNSVWEEGRLPLSPAPPRPGNYIYINPRGDDAPFKTRASAQPLIERINRRHPMARWLVLRDLNISRGTVISRKANIDGRFDMVARGLGSELGPIIATQRGSQYNLVGIGFSLIESDIVLRVALPILFINAIDWFRNDADSLYRAYRTGASWHVPVPSGVTKVHITDPNNKGDNDVPVHDGEVVFYGPYTGFYHLEPVGDTSDSAAPWTIAANFTSPRESRITTYSPPLPDQEGADFELDEQPRVDTDQSWAWVFNTFSEYDLWMYAIFAILGLLIVEWLSYHRRLTV